MAAEAARVGVCVSEWARDAVIGACARKAVPAKVPQPSGGKKLSIRFRSSDYKTVEAVAHASGLGACDFFRGCFRYVLDQHLDVSRPEGFIALKVNEKEYRLPVYGDKVPGLSKPRRRKRRRRAA